METSASKDISYSDKFQGAHPHTPRYFYESYCFSVTGKLAVFFILTGKTTAIQQDANTKPGGRTRREVWLLYLFSNAVQNLIHLHASRVPVVPKPNDDHAVFFRKDGLIHLPAIMQVREHVRHLEPTGLRGSGPAPPSRPMALPRNPPPQGASPRSPSRGVTLRGPHPTEPHHGAPTPRGLTLRGPHPTEPHHGAPGLRGLTPRGSRCAAGRARPASTKFRPRARHRNASAPRPRSQGEGPPGITHPRITRLPLPPVSSRARTSAHTGPSRSAVLPGA